MNGTLVGKEAPLFSEKAVVNGAIVDEFSLKDFEGRYVFFFFYPLDFTFVCPTELHAFQEKLSEFEKRDTALVACSVDSPYAHVAWLNTPRAQGGIAGITYPLVSDLNKTIAKFFGVLKEDAGVAFRGQFIIDPKGIVRHQLINDLPIGRSVDEALRLLDAVICFDTHGEVCPANWKNGSKTMRPDSQGLKDYFC